MRGWNWLVGAVGGCVQTGLVLPSPIPEETGTAPTAETGSPPVLECGDGVPVPGEWCFEPLVTHPAPGPGSRIDAGDLNGDGRPDLVTVLDQAGGLMSALVNDGRGAFTIGSSTPVWAADVRFVQANSGGVPDLFVSGIPFTGNAVVFGDGDAVLPATLDTYYYWDTMRRVEPVDWNQDGAMDIAVVVSGNDRMRVGFDLSRPSETISDGGFVGLAVGDDCTGVDLVVADLGGTGTPHAAVACAESYVTVYRYDPGTFPTEIGVQVGTATAVTGVPVAIEHCDLDDDSIDDLVVASAEGQLTVLRNNGSGRLSVVDAWAASETTADVVCADFDHDGVPDVATLEDGQTGERIRVRRGLGDLTLSGQTELLDLGPTRRDPSALLVTDLNGDDAPDIAVAFAWVDPKVPEPVVGTIFGSP